MLLALRNQAKRYLHCYNYIGAYIKKKGVNCVGTHDKVRMP